MTLGRVSPLLSGPGTAGNARSYMCACGQWISAIADDQGITLAVASHRNTTPHATWLAARYADSTYDSRPRFHQFELPLREGL